MNTDWLSEILIFIVCLVLLAGAFYIGSTDEYSVYSHYEKGNLIFSCKIMNGETIAICDNAKECNQICERHRFKQ